MGSGGKSFPGRFLGLLCLGLCFSLWTAGSGRAENRQEYAVKAAFVFNFVKFCTWPGGGGTAPAGSYDLYVVGDRELEPPFLGLDGKQVGNRRLRVSFKRSTDSFDHCDLVYISRDLDRPAILRILSAVKGRPVLTIGEIPDFARLGGMINLINRQEGGIRFEINLAAARQQQLVISSRVLKLATIVDSSDGRGE